jgi:hypothetical protein
LSFVIFAGFHRGFASPVRLTLTTGIINRISKAEQCKASFAFDGLNERQDHAKAPSRKGTETKKAEKSEAER